MSSKVEVERKARIETLLKHDDYKFIGFNGATMIRHKGPYERLTQEKMVQIMWQEFPGAALSNINEAQSLVSALAPDRTRELDGYIACGASSSDPKIWDMRKAEWTDDVFDYVYQTDIVPNDNTAPALKWLVEVADGDENLAQDYLQALAPLMLHNKPAGVIWFVGNGANGKSTMLKIIHKMFGRYLVSLTTSAVEDGRDTPQLNGMLGNVCLEASEARVEDSERYKAVGTHESFQVHKFHSQEMTTVNPTCHTIYNSNTIPTFRDKTKGSRRRTLVIPFNATFQDDPTYDERLMTPEFLGGFLTLLTETAKAMHERGTKYEWSDATQLAKQDYDESVNSAEAFMGHLHEVNAIGFTNYRMLTMLYENYCSANGLEALRVGSLKRSLMQEFPVTRRQLLLEDGRREWRYVWTDNFEGVDWWDSGLGTRGKVEVKMVQAALEDW